MLSYCCPLTTAAQARSCNSNRINSIGRILMPKNVVRVGANLHLTRTLKHRPNNGIRPEIASAATRDALKRRSHATRFLNPWVDLSVVTDDLILADKVESVTRTFGVVGALMCSLSAAALAVNPSAPANKVDDSSSNKNNGVTNETSVHGENQEDMISNFVKAFITTNHVAGTSLLVSWGMPPHQLPEYYSACCAGSFYSAVCAMGLSAVLNAWLGCTPPGLTGQFVRYHSLTILSIPAFLAISTGLAGVAVFTGLDITRGTPISYIGLGGTALGGLLIGSTTVRGMICTYRLLTPLVRAL